MRTSYLDAPLRIDLQEVGKLWLSHWAAAVRPRSWSEGKFYRHSALTDASIWELIPRCINVSVAAEL